MPSQLTPARPRRRIAAADSEAAEGAWAGHSGVWFFRALGGSGLPGSVST